MLHTVLPILGEAGLHQLVFLRIDGVAETTRILHGDFLIPTLIACSTLALEGIEARHVDVHVWQRQRNAGVAHVLVQVGGEAQRHAQAGKARIPRYRTGSRRLCQGLRVIHGREIVLLVARRSKVDTG